MIIDVTFKDSNRWKSRMLKSDLLIVKLETSFTLILLNFQYFSAEHLRVWSSDRCETFVWLSGILFISSALSLSAGWGGWCFEALTTVVERSDASRGAVRYPHFEIDPNNLAFLLPSVVMLSSTPNFFLCLYSSLLRLDCCLILLI